MIKTVHLHPTFREGDEVVLSTGTYEGTPGVFLRLKKDTNWADITERNGNIRSHPVAWLAHSLLVIDGPASQMNGGMGRAVEGWEDEGGAAVPSPTRLDRGYNIVGRRIEESETTQRRRPSGKGGVWTKDYESDISARLHARTNA